MLQTPPYVTSDIVEAEITTLAQAHNDGFAIYFCAKQSRCPRDALGPSVGVGIEIVYISRVRHSVRAINYISSGSNNGCRRLPHCQVAPAQSPPPLGSRKPEGARGAAYWGRTAGVLLTLVVA